MARTQARIGYKTYISLKRGTTEVPVWLKVAELKNVGGPSLSRDAPDATNMDSEEAWKEFVKGLKDGGEVTFEVNLIPASENTVTHLGHNADDGLLSDFADDETVETWRIEFPPAGAVTWTFPGILTSFEAGSPVDGIMTGSATFKVAGKPALA